MFKFFEKKKQLPEDSIKQEFPTEEPSIEEEVKRTILEGALQKEIKEKKIQEERKKMRPEVREMYKKIIEEAKEKGDTKKQKIYETALEELEQQISKDQEKKEE